MKKYKKIAYIFFIIIVIGISFTVYGTVNQHTEKIENEKIISEVKYLESELVDILNKLNNIEISDYSISVNNITAKSNNEEKEQTDNTNSNSQNNTNNEKSNSTNNNETEQKEFVVNKNGILTNNNDVNWENIKNKIENLYSTIPIITIDLYKSKNINQEDILNFNKEIDNLTVLIKNENKEKVLEKLSEIYKYIVGFYDAIYNKESDKLIIKTKYNILKAYSKIGFKNWDEILNDIKEASNIYSKLLTDTSIEQNKQNLISKVYVMINELQNAIQVQDESIFFIKYKKLIEEINLMI